MAKTRIQRGELDSMDSLLIWWEPDLLDVNRIGCQAFLLTSSGLQQITQYPNKLPYSDKLILLWAPDGGELYVNDSVYDTLHPTFKPPFGINLKHLPNQFNRGGTIAAISSRDLYAYHISTLKLVNGVEVPLDNNESRTTWREWLYDIDIYDLKTNDQHWIRANTSFCKWLYDGRLAIIQEDALRLIDPNNNCEEERIPHKIPFSWNDSDLSPLGTHAVWVMRQPDDRPLFGELSHPLVVSNLQGANLSILGDLNFWDAPPAWSPDGSKIAWVDDGNGRALYVADADGSNNRRLVDLDEADGGETVPGTPVWSSDSRQIAIESCEFDHTLDDSGSTVFVMDANGDNLRHVMDAKGLIYRLQWRPTVFNQPLSNQQ